jgi:exodeoxyribonuclease VIII
MTFDDYSKVAAVNWSSLKEARRSPLHYRYRVETPKEDTARLALGRATHTAVFEPDRFLLDFVLWDGGDRRGKAYAAFCEQHPNQTILKAEEYATCLAMRDAVRSHPIAGPALAPPGEAEKVLTWTDQATGLPCKCRIDWWRPGLLSDLKTTVDVSPRRFGPLAERMGYHGQMAFYRAGLVANGLDAPLPRIIAVEAAAPHDVAVFVVDDDALWAGEQLVAELLALVAAGRFSDQWPGQCPEEVPLPLPAWAFKEDEGDATGLGIVFGSSA